MVVVSGEIGGQSLNAGGDFQKAISETVGLRFGNGRVTAAAGNPFGNLTIVRRFGRRSERFHDRRVTLCRTRSNLSPLRRPTDALREEFPGGSGLCNNRGQGWCRRAIFSPCASRPAIRRRSSATAFYGSAQFTHCGMRRLWYANRSFLKKI